MSKLFAAQLGALSKFVSAVCELRVTGTGQMMNCKLDASFCQWGNTQRVWETHTTWIKSQGERENERERESESERKLVKSACSIVLFTLCSSFALSKLKSCSRKLLLTISSKTKDLPDFETIMLSSSVNKINWKQSTRKIQ